MGDFNLDYEAPRSAEEFELVNLIHDTGLDYQGYKDNYSFKPLHVSKAERHQIKTTKINKKIDPVETRSKGCSKIEHCFML